MKEKSQAMSETERALKNLQREYEEGLTHRVELQDAITAATERAEKAEAAVDEIRAGLAAKDAALAQIAKINCTDEALNVSMTMAATEAVATAALAPDAEKGWLSPDRTRSIQWCLSEVLRWHSDPQSPDYNECEKAPCHWCAVARELVGETNCGAQPASNLEQPPVAVPG